MTPSKLFDRSRRACRGLLAGLIVAFAGLSGFAAAADELDILRGKTIRFIIGGDAGSGTNLYGRPFIERLQKALPDTEIRAQNMSGASGGLALTEAAAAGGDVITLVVINNTPVFSQMRGSALAAYDLRQFHWIGSLTTNQRTMAMRKLLGPPKLDTLRSLGRLPVAVVSDAGSPSHLETVVISAMTGIPMKIVVGVDEDQRDAFILAGDADIVTSSYFSLVPLVESGDLVPVLKLSAEGYPPELADLPTLAEASRPGTPQALIRLMESLNKTGRLIAAAPATDPSVVTGLRSAFDQIMAEGELEKDFAEQKLVYAPTGGAELAERIDEALDQGEVGEHLKSYMECGERLSSDPTTTCAAD
jgi:tripartite-type tricarboxylate transporter receptor subunit TctC